MPSVSAGALQETVPHPARSSNVHSISICPMGIGTAALTRSIQHQSASPPIVITQALSGAVQQDTSAADTLAMYQRCGVLVWLTIECHSLPMASREFRSALIRHGPRDSAD